jgi:hypothetical protein
VWTSGEGGEPGHAHSSSLLSDKELVAHKHKSTARLGAFEMELHWKDSEGLPTPLLSPPLPSPPLSPHTLVA